MKESANHLVVVFLNFILFAGGKIFFLKIHLIVFYFFLFKLRKHSANGTKNCIQDIGKQK
jgi:hypothetical protein